MTLHRRPLGRARWIAIAGAIVIIVGCILPWFRAGGDNSIPPLEGNGFYGTGTLVFFAALAIIALVALPYAIGDRPVAVDRWWAYAAIAGIAAVALLLRAVGIAAESGGIGTIVPDRAPGLWLTAIGVLALLYATAEMHGARPD
jgi:hypothetical protein